MNRPARLKQQDLQVDESLLFSAFRPAKALIIGLSDGGEARPVMLHCSKTIFDGAAPGPWADAEPTLTAPH